MISTLFSIGWRSLRRSKVEMMVVFLVPIAFFSIFALIFGGQGGDSTPKVKIAIANLGGEFSSRLATALSEESTLTIYQPIAKDAVPTPLDRDGARKLVKDGKVSVAVVLPKELQLAFGPTDGARASVELAYDSSDPIAPQVVAGMLQKCAMTAAPDLMVGESKKWMETFAGGLSDAQSKEVDRWMNLVKADSKPTTQPAGREPKQGGTDMSIVPVTSVDVVRQGTSKNIIAFYAAGIAVMFLLFSAAGGGGVLLEEEESGTLERVLSTNVGMTRLLVGKWLFLTVLGLAQIVVMFSWGVLMFGLEMKGHVMGFILMTLVTSGAAASFGLLLATACRSRGQLSGISTIVILMMSALGGSMFPRFLMSESMQKMGLFTFNAWALDGYVKVFWRDANFWEVGLEVGVLATIGTVFFIVARLMARRWETA